MTSTEIFYSRKTNKLFYYEQKFIFLKNLYKLNKLPKVLLLTGEKGIGKSTLVSHFMHYIYDTENYDSKKYSFVSQTNFDNQFLNNYFPNIIYLEGQSFKTVRIEEIRKLKTNLLKKPIIQNKRFIILDDVDLFNANSLNALLKVIEEPGISNFFILINNKSRPLIETLKSRCIEIKYSFDEEVKKKIMQKLIDLYDQKMVLNPELANISPGNFLKFNHILSQNEIDLNDSFLKNLNKLITLFKKEKNYILRDLLMFYTDYYFKNFKYINEYSKSKSLNKRSFIIKKLNEFFLYNLNQTTLINSIETNIIE